MTNQHYLEPMSGAVLSDVVKRAIVSSRNIFHPPTTITALSLLLPELPI